MDADPRQPEQARQSANEPSGASAQELNYLSVTQAASRLGCTEQHVRKLCRDGELASHRSGDGRKTWLVVEASVDLLVARRPTPQYRQPTDDGLFAELQLASVRVQAGELEAELAKERAKNEIAQARIGELERLLASAERTVEALVRAQSSLLGVMGNSEP